jgi:hypothetical protein
MKKLRNLIAVMAMMSMAAVLTGCGDDDDDDDNDQPPGNTIVAPGDEAALTAQNKIYTVTVAGDTNQTILTFPANGQYQIVRGDVTETGTISAAARNVNTWTFTKTPNAGQDGAQAGTVRLDFTTADQGTWTFTPDGGTAETGTFGLTTTGGGDDGGNGGGGSLDSVAGKTLQLTYQPTGGEKFAFGTDNSVSYENGSETGTYTYDATSHRVSVTLGNGWHYDIDLADNGTATVNFQQTPGGTVETQSASYTLN